MSSSGTLAASWTWGMGPLRICLREHAPAHVCILTVAACPIIEGLPILMFVSVGLVIDGSLARRARIPEAIAKLTPLRINRRPRIILGPAPKVVESVSRYSVFPLLPLERAK